MCHIIISLLYWGGLVLGPRRTMGWMPVPRMATPVRRWLSCSFSAILALLVVLCSAIQAARGAGTAPGATTAFVGSSCGSGALGSRWARPSRATSRT
ncbi:unnamed protein product, partial [Ectocarpus fasciculatus]